MLQRIKNYHVLEIGLCGSSGPLRSRCQDRNRHAGNVSGMLVKVKRRTFESAGKLSDHSVGLIPVKGEGEGKRIGKKS